jgi:hypothetical protein
MNAYSRENHAIFLDIELQAQIAAFQQKIETSAVSLLENGELFVAQFIKFRGSEMMVKMNTERRGVPRRKDTLRAMLVIPGLQGWKNWGNMTYGELIKKGQVNYSDATCIWHHRDEDSKYTLVGFRGLSIPFAEVLEEGFLVVFGPPEPPFEYLANLISIVNRPTVYSLTDKLLDSPVIENNTWLPTPIHGRYDLIRDQIALSDIVIVQGPPGTGKTHLLAQIATQLLNEGKSVLATALTHRALFELASKEALKVPLNNKKLYKKGITLEERDSMPALQEAENMHSSPGCLTLATFYSSSAWANNIKQPIYDVVLVDEASQAFLAMLAASCWLGRKIIWIGDPAQLPPVVIMSQDTISKLKASPLIFGMTTVLAQSAFPAFRLVETYRLSERAAEFTGVFYDGSLTAAKSSNRPSLYLDNLPSDIQNLLHPEGGPVLLPLPFPPGDATPELLIRAILHLVKGFLKVEDKSLTIAILAKQKKTVSRIQWTLSQHIGHQENIVIETVERVQGLTCDICIFVIPDSSKGLSLHPNFFNVATSRARRHTIIISPENLLDSIRVDERVTDFIKRLLKEKNEVITINH